MIIFFKKVLKRAYYNFLFNPKKKIIRKLSHYSIYTNPSFLRISSKPYISGDTFRNYSDHIFDETRSIVPKKVKKGDIVFLKTELKDIFFSEYHKKIKYPYNRYCRYKRWSWINWLYYSRKWWRNKIYQPLQKLFSANNWRCNCISG